MKPSQSYKSFLRYAPHIATVLNNWPGPCTFNPAPLTVNTFSDRFREAVRAGWRFDYGAANLLDMRLYEKHHASFSFSMQDDMVVVGSREAIAKAKKAKACGSHVLRPTASEGVEVPFIGNPEFPLIDIKDLCEMIMSGFFPSKPIFVVSDLTEQNIQELEEIYNVGIIPHETEPGKFKIL